jgi:hypothetical protein
VPYDAVAFLLIFAAVAGGIERVLRKFPVTDGSDFMEGCDELAPVPGLDRMEPGDTVRDILHVASGHYPTGHLLEAECNCGYSHTVSSIGAKWHRTSSTNNRKGAVRSDTIDHTGNPLLVRDDPDIGLDRGLPRMFVAGGDAEIKERSHVRIDGRANHKGLSPDQLRIKQIPKMIGELFTDRIPVGFRHRNISFIIIPDRARMYPHKIRDRNIIPVGSQDNTSYYPWKPARLYLLKRVFTTGHPEHGRKVSFMWKVLKGQINNMNSFLASGQT